MNEAPQFCPLHIEGDEDAAGDGQAQLGWLVADQPERKLLLYRSAGNLSQLIGEIEHALHTLIRYQYRRLPLADDAALNGLSDLSRRQVVAINAWLDHVARTDTPRADRLGGKLRDFADFLRICDAELKSAHAERRAAVIMRTYGVFGSEEGIGKPNNAKSWFLEEPYWSAPDRQEVFVHPTPTELKSIGLVDPGSLLKNLGQNWKDAQRGHEALRAVLAKQDNHRVRERHNPKYVVDVTPRRRRTPRPSGG
jgi:hypothetical protein